MRPIVVLAALVLALSVGTGGSHAAGAQIVVVPSATSIRASGAVAGSQQISLDVAGNEREDAVLVVEGASHVQVAAPSTVGPMSVQLFFAHYVSFGGTPIPDALLAWSGAQRAAEEHNQPIWLQFTVPADAPAGTYQAAVTVTADGNATQVPIAVRVFPVSLPAANATTGNLFTAFHVAPETYNSTVGKAAGYTRSEQFQQIPPTLYSFLASYRISPNSWGFGAPTSKSGYTTSAKWWLDSSTNMALAAKDGIFAAMSIPLSNNRTSPRNYIAGLSPFQPGTWCSYLKSVHVFWQEHGWSNAFAYLYGLDEPGLPGFHTVAQQASTLHSCFPGGRELVTGNPSTRNRFLWNGGSDDVDVWVVLGNRYYGQYTNPAQSRRGISHAREKLKLIDAVRARGKQVWTYTYPNTQTPGFTATEPLSDSALVFLWAALENIRGVLYGEGTTDYQGDPYSSVGANGAFVLLYPSLGTPTPSARLEQIRDGIEDWDLFDMVRRKHGAAEVRSILGRSGLFSASAGGVTLACTIGCPLKSSTPFSWPRYSHDASTPKRIEQAKLLALEAAS